MLDKSRKIKMTRLDDDTKHVYVYAFQVEAHLETGWVQHCNDDVYVKNDNWLQSVKFDWGGGNRRNNGFKRIFGVGISIPEIYDQLTDAGKIVIALALASPAVAAGTYFLVDTLLYNRVVY